MPSKGSLHSPKTVVSGQSVKIVGIIMVRKGIRRTIVVQFEIISRFAHFPDNFSVAA